jgi:predicted unusual protein kinase regulating ubiquinone biosynthesis (AarF/ABC1/UbiB family)
MNPLKTLKLAKLAVAIPAYPLVPRPCKQRYAGWLRGEVERAGCLYVKIGQWVSSRTDIFPEEITEEFASLRTGSEPMPPEAVAQTLRGFTFEAFDQAPVSTGSIAQVHRARFQGRDVAVKVQRPLLLAQLLSDVGAVKYVLGFGRAVNPKMVDDLTCSLDDLIDTVKRELDFQAEADHMRRFGGFFDPAFVTIPRVIASSPTVIIMDYVETRPFRGSANALMALFFRQFFELGWLHTDMHAGNLGQTPEGGLVLFDFGSVMEVPQDICMCIKALMVSYLNRDVSVMLDYMCEYDMLVGSPGAEERRMLEAFLVNVLDYVEVTDMQKFTRVMQTIPVTQAPSAVFRSEIFMIMRSFTLMEGLCKALDPEFVILDSVTPLTEYFSRDPMILRLKIEDDLRTVLKSLERRPGPE